MHTSFVAVLVLTLLVSCDHSTPQSSLDTVVSPGTSAARPKRKEGGEPAPTRLREIVVEVMNRYYGTERDEANDCWKYTHHVGDEATEYCMRPAEPNQVEKSADRILYLRASNRLDVPAAEKYHAITPGLMGAFEIRLDGKGQWQPLATAPALAFGTVGYCGCDGAKFVQVGADRYGWLFTSGGTWQGITVSNYEIVTSIDGEFKAISDIPEIREEQQDASYAIEIMAKDAGDAFYPIEVTKTASGQRTKKTIVTFDPKEGMYRLPETF